MTSIRRFAAIILALRAISGGAFACSDETELAMFDALQVGKIKTGGKAHFYDATCDGGAKGLEACRRKAFVMPGDAVLIGDVRDTTACATYVDAKGRATSGVLLGNRIEHDAGGDTKQAAALVGRWVREEAEIKVSRKGADLSIEGEATYGAKDAGRVARGAVNMGNFEFVARPTSNRISVGLKDGASAVPKSQAGDTDCQLDMIALGPFLVVRDNRQCGGMNVSFTGVYRKR